MVNVTIIDTMKTKELDNGKFMTTHKAQDLEAKQYTFNFFGQPLKKGTEVELIKQGLYWNFVKILEDEEATNHTEIGNTKIPNADEYIVKEQDKYLFGQSCKVAYSFYSNNESLPDTINKVVIKKQIKVIFETLKESRKELLGY